MVISRQHPLVAHPRATAAPQETAPQEPQDGFTPSDKSTSWFHRTTGGVAGAGVGATLGTMLIGPMGNGMGGEGLIYPIAGFLGGAAAGLVGGAVLAGKFSSDENGTSAFHRTTATVAGVLVGGVAGVMLLGPAGNGKGAEGLAYAFMGLVGGAVAGGAGGFAASGHFPDKA